MLAVKITKDQIFSEEILQEINKGEFSLTR